jgi:hypothetical protein
LVVAEGAVDRKEESPMREPVVVVEVEDMQNISFMNHLPPILLAWALAGLEGRLGTMPEPLEVIRHSEAPRFLRALAGVGEGEGPLAQLRPSPQGDLVALKAPDRTL